MAKAKMPIDVILEDGKIAVRCAHGEWLVGGLDNRWLWVLGAIAFPEEHSINIYDKREHRQDHQKDMTTKERPTEDVAPKKVYALCEETERDDAIRQFTIHALSEDRDALRQLLAAKVSKDEYGLIGSNGVNRQGPDYFLTNDDNNEFVEYYILEKDALTREQTLALLKTKEYQEELNYPENLRDILLDAVRNYAKEENYGTGNWEPTVDAIMADQKFRAIVKQSFWGEYDCIPNKTHSRVAGVCSDFLDEKLEECPDFFFETGSIPVLLLPDNLEDIVIDAIYDVSKAFHLPVSAPEKVAERVMRNADFQKAICNCSGDAVNLAPGSATYQLASDVCTQYAAELLSKENPFMKVKGKTRLDQMITSAQQCASSSAQGSIGQERDTGR